jgi:hypothetical protein
VAIMTNYNDFLHELDLLLVRSAVDYLPFDLANVKDGPGNIECELRTMPNHFAPNVELQHVFLVDVAWCELRMPNETNGDFSGITCQGDREAPVSSNFHLSNNIVVSMIVLVLSFVIVHSILLYGDAGLCLTSDDWCH